MRADGYELADLTCTFTPQTDLYILNYIANYIVQNNAVNKDFVAKHCTFKKGNTDIGFGLDNHVEYCNTRRRTLPSWKVWRFLS